MTIPIGIDLGTTYSVVAYLAEDGRPRVIPDAAGRATTPSVVGFSEGRIVVGDEAKELQAAGASEIASFFKRAMGDPDFVIELGIESFDATGLSALILRHLAERARDHLGQPVTRAVITVPAYFNNVQRSATIGAGRTAGLDVLSIVSEPTAAALSYGVRAGSDPETILVYDLGGGTFDVSLVAVTDRDLRVIATNGDHNLGGKDWDDRLIGELAHRFRAEFAVDLIGDDYQDLLVRAEALKRGLSARESADIPIAGNGHAATYRITRAEFEELTADLLERTRALIDLVLQEAGLGWADIHRVIPVGGSTRMPMVQRLLAELTGGLPAVAGVHPDEAVALGAAIQAALDVEKTEPAGPRFLLSGRREVVDVMSHSLGMIAVSPDQSRYVNSILIRKNQPIPTEQSRPYRLRLSQQRENRLEVFLTQGEQPDPFSCVYLGKYVLTGIPAANREATLDVTFAYDQSGVVQVSAVDRATATPLTLSVEPLPNDVPGRFAGSPAAELARSRATVYLVFDVSGSMEGEPLAAAKRAACAFLDNCDLGAMAVGILSVADRTQVLLPACDDAGAIRGAIASLSSSGGNDADPFEELLRLMPPHPAPRFAVVLADGVWSNQGRARRRAKACHAAGIEVIGVGFGGADAAFLRDISSADAGVFTDISRLSETFTTIAQELADLGLQAARGRVMLAS